MRSSVEVVESPLLLVRSGRLFEYFRRRFSEPSCNVLQGHVVHVVDLAVLPFFMAFGGSSVLGCCGFVVVQVH